ncbi:unnamed protein product [Cyclocybe aegerita]|uniref:RRM domain-containing protein n=1 Tax=Cyclocybe aegerita TaxID=1973307 RepID=A0A8S0VSJ5_CYCAE|nr:unnamed protein product [Cyclocybe aegerita]
MSAFRSRKPYARPATRALGADGQWLHDKAPTGPAKARIPNRVSVAPTLPAAAVNNALLVSNLHYEVTPKDLIAIFGQIGTLIREPLLRYDRSGRSSGEAVLSFESATEATRAKKQFQGILAKGQPMSISYYAGPPRAPRSRAVSAPGPTTQSLLNRIEKPPLADRISQDDSAVKTPSGPRALTGPVRNKPTRGAKRAPRAAKAPTKPKTADELDKELDAFMGDADETPAATTEAPTDVDMV